MNAKLLTEDVGTGKLNLNCGPARKERQADMPQLDMVGMPGEAAHASRKDKGLRAENIDQDCTHFLRIAGPYERKLI